jgi:hypothetical protein
MRIETRTTNYVRPANIQARQVRNNPNFTGSATQVVEEAARKFDLDNAIKEAIPGKRIFEIMQKFETLRGEAGGILITALGTGIVAPMVIGTNPLVKAKPGATEDEKKEVYNKKWYTAWRQPISAILAILFQLGAQKPIDKFLNAMFNNPKYSKYVNIHDDQSAVRGESYLKGIVKDKMKADGKQKPSWFGYFTDSKNTKKAREEYNKAIADNVKAEMEKDINKIADGLKSEGIIRISDRVLDNPTLAKLVNATIEDSIAVARDLRFSDKDLTHYAKKAELLMGNEGRIKEIFSNVPTDEKELETYLRDTLAKETNTEVQELLRETLKKSPKLRYSRISRTLERIKYITNMCGGKENFSRDNYIKAMSERNGVLDKIITNLNISKIEDPKKATTAQIQDAINEFIKYSHFEQKDNLLKSILHDTKTFDFDKEKLTQKIYKDIAKTYKKFVAHSYKAINQLTKVAVGIFITLPITCTALNYIYPRFMELFFPDLAGTKKAPKEQAEGGTK